MFHMKHRGFIYFFGFELDFGDFTADFTLCVRKNRRFFIVGAVYIWVILDFTTDFKLNNGKNRRFFIGGAVYI